MGQQQKVVVVMTEDTTRRKEVKYVKIIGTIVPICMNIQWQNGLNLVDLG